MFGDGIFAIDRHIADKNAAFGAQGGVNVVKSCRSRRDQFERWQLIQNRTIDGRIYEGGNNFGINEGAGISGRESFICQSQTVAWLQTVKRCRVSRLYFEKRNLHHSEPCSSMATTCTKLKPGRRGFSAFFRRGNPGDRGPSRCELAHLAQSK